MADEAEEVVQGSRTGTEQAKALDKVTDQGEEKEVKNVDWSGVQASMTKLAQRRQAEQEATRQRDRALAAVKIKAEDVEVIVREFELDVKTAERRLREHDGSLHAALEALIDEE